MRSLTRVVPLLADPCGEINYQLAFSRDDLGRALVRVSVNGLLRLHCQRCLDILEWRIEERALLALVLGLDEAARLPDRLPDAPNGYEPLLIDASRLRPLSIIEDEVLLALPAIPRHADCAPLVG